MHFLGATPNLKNRHRKWKAGILKVCRETKDFHPKIKVIPLLSTMWKGASISMTLSLSLFFHFCVYIMIYRYKIYIMIHVLFLSLQYTWYIIYWYCIFFAKENWNKKIIIQFLVPMSSNVRPTRTGSQQFVAGYPKQLGALSYLLGQKYHHPDWFPIEKRMLGNDQLHGVPFFKGSFFF